MNEAEITALNRRRGNIKAQVTRIFNATHGKTFNLSEWKAHLDSLSKTEEKFEALKNEYYRIIEEDKLEEIDRILSQLDEDILKLEKQKKDNYLEELKAVLELADLNEAVNIMNETNVVI